MATNVIVHRRKNQDIENLIKIFNEKCRKEKIFKKVREHEFFQKDANEKVQMQNKGQRNKSD